MGGGGEEIFFFLIRNPLALEHNYLSMINELTFPDINKGRMGWVLKMGELQIQSAHVQSSEGSVAGKRIHSTQGRF